MEGIVMFTGKELGKAIADALALKGYGAKAALARYLGIKPPSVADMTKFGRIDKAKLPSLWRYFSDVVEPSHWGLGQYPWINQISGQESNVEEAPSLRPFRPVPVVGTVQGGDNGYFTELEYPTGQGDGAITYPAKDDNSYALRVRGDSMRPRIKNGEFIVVEPNHQPQPGDDVVVCLLDGRKMVKELLYTRDGEITLGSINNGHGNITVTVDQVEKMHYVAAIIPRGAFYKA